MGKNTANQRAHEKSLVVRAELLDLIRGNPARKQPPLSVRAACDALGISRRTPITWCQQDPAFAQAYDDAKEDGIDILEDEANRRAMGIEEDVFGVGEDGEPFVVGKKVRYSDDLLKFMLAGRRAAVFRPNNQINTQVNVALEGPSDRDVAKALALLVEEVKQKQTVE